MWSLLKEKKDWDAYQQKVITDAGLTSLAVSFGAGPKEYPTLVATYCPQPAPGVPPKLLSAYLYCADAEELLAAGRPVPQPVLSKPILPPDATPAQHLEAAKPDRPRQADCNRWLIANILAIIKTMREIKATDAKRYEADLMEALELVDEEAQVRADKLCDEDKALLAHLDRGE